VATARRNAERAGVAGRVRFATGDLSELVRPPGPPGLVVCNPPYGRRLGTRGTVRPVFAQLGAVLSQRFAGYRAAVLCPDRRLERELRALVVARHSLDNGGIRVELLLLAF